MSTKELKQAISDDIDTMKHLELEIMPADDYYLSHFKLFAQLFGLLYGVTIASALFWFSVKQHDVLSADLLIQQFIVAFVGTIFASGFCVLMASFGINYYLILKNQLQHHLKTSPYLLKIVKKGSLAAYGFFSLIVFVGAAIGNPLYGAPIAEFVACILTSSAAGFFVSLELRRVGLSVLLNVIKAYYDKQEKGFG